MKTIAEAQQDMREAYFGGAPGAVSSATAWLAAALVATLVSPKAGIITLIFGGMLIFPASVILCKLLGRRGKHAGDNPLAPLAIYGTIWMLLLIPVAIAAAFYRIDLFFPAMLLVIGGRYLTFETLYGNKTYLVMGAALAIAACALVALHAPASWSALAGALIEYVFGTILFVKLLNPVQAL